MHLLVAIDGSSQSAEALAYAGKLALAANASVAIYHQVSEVSAPRALAELSEQPEEAGALLEQARETLHNAGVQAVTTRVGRGLRGEEAEGILAAATDEKADVIVVGPRGAGRWAQLLLGSVTSRLIQVSDRPVLVVR